MDIDGNSRALLRLKRDCGNARGRLFLNVTSKLTLCNEGIIFYITITGDKFEQVNREFFQVYGPCKILLDEMPSRGRSCMMAFIWMRPRLMVPPYKLQCLVGMEMRSFRTSLSWMSHPYRLEWGLKPNDDAWNLWNSKEQQNSLKEKLYHI